MHINHEMSYMVDSNKQPQISKILVPVDKTPLSIKAARYAIHLADVEKAEIVILLNVIEDIKQGGAIGLQAKYGNMNLVREFEELRRQSAMNVMDSIVTGLPEKEQSKVNIKREILNANGRSVAKVVGDYAHNNNIDIIIIGSRKLAKWKYLLLGGSVTARIIDNSKCHVMLIR